MDYVAEARNIRISPRKVRLVVNGIKKMPIQQAIVALRVLHKRAAEPIKKVLESAMANAVNNSKATKESLVIKEIMVNEGVKYKRYHFAGRGRTRPYVRRSSHIRVVLSAKPIVGISSTPAVVTQVASQSTGNEKGIAKAAGLSKRLISEVGKRVGRKKSDEVNKKEGGAKSSV